MLHVHTIGRIGKDCQVINGAHGSFIAFDIAVDDYSHGNNITTWVRVRSKKENHIRLSEYLTKGRLLLIEGTLSASLWKDKEENYQIQLSITADTLQFINTGKRENATSDATNLTDAADVADDAPTPPNDMPQADKEDLPF
ncbi:single-stranded DNA-binding protein [uncultured Bacteroides sp.]|uniref:single-stranded DNA-binding protein n=1 Tax=uncultured Bacteroides sp. TaxID=162156 RepID=UPI0026073AEB|nr:single-stranded DNA-binding protein [uncultured Bacteroides sp.]